jgi:hypothetical protein
MKKIKIQPKFSAAEKLTPTASNQVKGGKRTIVTDDIDGTRRFIIVDDDISGTK